MQNTLGVSGEYTSNSEPANIYSHWCARKILRIIREIYLSGVGQPLSYHYQHNNNDNQEETMKDIIEGSKYIPKSNHYANFNNYYKLQVICNNTNFMSIINNLHLIFNSNNRVLHINSRIINSNMPSHYFNVVSKFNILYFSTLSSTLFKSNKMQINVCSINLVPYMQAKTKRQDNVKVMTNIKVDQNNNLKINYCKTDKKARDLFEPNLTSMDDVWNYCKTISDTKLNYLKCSDYVDQIANIRRLTNTIKCRKKSQNSGYNDVIINNENSSFQLVQNNLDIESNILLNTGRKPKQRKTEYIITCIKDCKLCCNTPNQLIVETADPSSLRQKDQSLILSNNIIINYNSNEPLLLKPLSKHKHLNKTHLKLSTLTEFPEISRNNSFISFKSINEVNIVHNNKTTQQNKSPKRLFKTLKRKTMRLFSCPLKLAKCDKKNYFSNKIKLMNCFSL